MMGYTHAAIGAAGATGILFAMGGISPENYVIATTAGVIGGVLVDIDVRDNKSGQKISDASRTRWVMLGLIVVCLLLDYWLEFGIFQRVIKSKNSTVIGMVFFGLVLCTARMIKGHRTFSHSLLFIFLTTIGVYLIYPPMTLFYFGGSVLHVLVDLLNNPVPGSYDDWKRKHGIWLFYPIVKRKGIALGVCKAGEIGNKIIYFIGAVTYIVLSGIYCYLLRDVYKILPIVFVVCYLVLSLHLVRKKSEKELQGKKIMRK